MRKAVSIISACLIVNVLITPGVWAGQEFLLAANAEYAKAEITSNPPQMHVEQEADLPTAGEDDTGESWFSRYKWWLLAGLVVVGGAAAAGGGGGGGGGSSTSDAPTTGNIQIDW